MAFNKTGANDGKTVSVHNPETGKTSFACPDCEGMSESQMTKKAFVGGETGRVCAKCGASFKA